MRSILETVRGMGAVDAALMAVDRALSALSGGRARVVKYYFMAQPVPAKAVSKARAGGIAVEEVAAGDPRLASFERPATELARRFANASRCFAAWQGETLTGFLWFTARQYEEDEVRCTFRLNPADSAVWDFDVNVFPRFRLGRTFAILWDSAFAAMRESGVRWSISRVSAFKPDSIRAHQRLGARRTGWAVFLLLGSVQITFNSLGQLKCRSLEQPTYPVLDVHAPTEHRRPRGDGRDDAVLVGGAALDEQTPPGPR